MYFMPAAAVSLDALVPVSREMTAGARGALDIDM
jgi:hypothetical protein